MNYKLKRFSVALKTPYSDHGPSNPYEGKIELDYNKTELKITLSNDLSSRILAMCASEIAAACAVRMQDIQNDFLAATANNLIEGETDA